MPPLELTIRRKVYRAAGAPPLEAVRGLSLRFPPGTVTALLGPSGCGKSTALRILMGLDADFEGEVRHRPARLGVVFQSRALDADLSVAQNLAYHAALHGIRRRDALPRIAEVLEPVFASLTLQTLQTLNGRIQVGGEPAAAVAEDYLTRSGLLK